MAGSVGTFFREFVRDPLHTGAVLPSSQRLAEEAVSVVPPTGEPVVVELGPGTGAFTEAIQRRLAGRGHHVAVELNPRFADLVATRFPTVDVVCADAATLPDLLTERGLARADVIVSGLPWAAFPTEVQNRLLNAVTRTLVPDGAFTTFAYIHALRLPPARRFRKRLTECFHDVMWSQTVWRNVPPAMVYLARRPRVST